MTDEVVLELSDKLGMAASDVSNHLFELIPQWAAMNIIRCGIMSGLLLILAIVCLFGFAYFWKIFKQDKKNMTKAQQIDNDKRTLDSASLKFDAEDKVNRDFVTLVTLTLVFLTVLFLLGDQLGSLLSYIFVPEPMFWQTIISTLK